MITKTKILIVGHRPEILEALEAILRDLDAETIITHNNHGALDLCLKHDFAVALLDGQLNGIDELIHGLKSAERSQHLPFIFISGSRSGQSVFSDGFAKGAFTFITEPFRSQEVIEKIKLFTELHQLQDALSRSNNELREIKDELDSFSYSVSHDLRAPLRAITGYSQILEEDFLPVLEEEGQKIFNRIKQNATEMGAMIEGLLIWARLGRRQLHKADVNMHELVQQIVDRLGYNLPHHAQIKISELPPAEADLALIQQVWTNLISNAIKFSSKKTNPLINIGSEEINGKTAYFIKDNGAGFDTEYIGKLFGIFKRMHNREDFEGMGIELAIVKRIIGKHGGEIWCTAKIDEGACFYFTLG